jgi:hypothetical protein
MGSFHFVWAIVARTNALFPSSAEYTGLVKDYIAQVIFCQWSEKQCGTNSNFLAFVIRTNETHFTRNEIENYFNLQL